MKVSGMARYKHWLCVDVRTGLLFRRLAAAFLALFPFKYNFMKWVLLFLTVRCGNLKSGRGCIAYKSLFRGW